MVVTCCVRKQDEGDSIINYQVLCILYSTRPVTLLRRPDKGSAEVPRHLVLALELVPHRVQKRRAGHCVAIGHYTAAVPWSHVSNGSPGPPPVRFGYLSCLGVVLQVRHQVLQHLAAGPLLHPRKLRGGVRCSLPVDDLGQQPVSEHGALPHTTLSQCNHGLGKCELQSESLIVSWSDVSMLLPWQISTAPRGRVCRRQPRPS